MIFVTLGTQKFQLLRLLNLLDELIKNGVIKERVLVQAGYTQINSDRMELHKFLSKTDMEMFIKSSNLVIAHGGTSSIIQALSHEKKVLAVPRLKKFHEHVDDHQLDIVSEFKKKNYLEVYLDNDSESLAKQINKLRHTNYKKYTNDNKRLLEDIFENIV
ncbi:glycosyltransferase [Rossellomorea marisflavi]|uniref:glycosyltransferase n=1 Tax=Rossellomorea marisflavi TaxID=189381 RepID=UPI003459A73C